MKKFNPCILCGACCAYYRASFYWAETDASPGGTVPEAMTEKLNDFRVVMKGTDQNHPHCLALLGIVGKKVRCSIYENRASVCRNFDPSWQNGQANEGCDKARLFWGLKPLSPAAWQPPTKFPKAA